jgi:hypothetical protein
MARFAMPFVVATALALAASCSGVHTVMLPQPTAPRALVFQVASDFAIDPAAVYIIERADIEQARALLNVPDTGERLFEVYLRSEAHKYTCRHRAQRQEGEAAFRCVTVPERPPPVFEKWPAAAHS